VAGIFNSGIFNRAIFNTAAVAQAETLGTGGYPQRRWTGYARSEKERKRVIERIEAQIRGPQKKAVAKVIARVVEQEPEDLSEVLLIQLEAEALKFKALYLDILREEVRRKEREDDDEVAILMLMH